jgi:hypothetical protein
MGKRSEDMHASIASRLASQSTGRAKGNLSPGKGAKAYEIGCCYPVSENLVVQVPPD